MFKIQCCCEINFYRSKHMHVIIIIIVLVTCDYSSLRFCAEKVKKRALQQSIVINSRSFQTDRNVMFRRIIIY